MVRLRRPMSSSSKAARQTLSREERRARRAEEARVGAAGALSAASARRSTRALWLSVGVGTGALSFGGWALLADPKENKIARVAQESTVGALITEQVSSACAPFTKPSREKLLPDWPPDYLNISPDVPCPHTLVVDLDDTLVRATWDRRYGWRHAKRPGADSFLREMSKYYEIVIFTSNIAGVADPVVHALDKDGCAMHRLYRDATQFVRGTHCKDLSRLNRDLRKVVVLDDDPRAVQLQPENAILVTPYLNPSDKSDSELEDITPFLIAIVNEGVTDVPAALAKFSDREAATVAREYGDMLALAKQKSAAVRSIGLGGFVRSGAPHLPPPDNLAATGGITAKDIVGDAPPPDPPTKGRLWQRYADTIKEADENHRRKMEAWQKVLQKKEQQKRLDAERAFSQ
ncbi:hypothetical protein CTAYLR_005211 [Chrysophaeum taylorii]|uniref:Mitochondrial import inner membrane translocase subunit TIM50 n=1 Tax=Chrysophaeum taylorii TaxID=2483200 RepID=A0AAD7UDK1_9STRA|nr:hypothetical protein CTAYLR_005211 [Chrysophaeum taylorii]